MAKKAIGGRAMTVWDEEFARAAEQEAASRAPIGTGQQIGTRGGVLALNGDPIKGNKLKAVIMARLYENAYYEDKFDPDDPKAPVCFAFSDPAWKGTEVAKMMKPHEMSSKRQNEDCATCKWNKFGSADTGKGKACKNIIRLGLLPEDALENAKGVESAEMATLKSPVTSVRGYHQYEELVHNTAKRPMWGVLTEIGAVQDPKVQYRLTFSMAEKLGDQKILPPLKARIPQALQDLASPYQPSEENEAPAKASRVKAKPKGKAFTKDEAKRKGKFRR